jgi:hypothetical protein
VRPLKNACGRQFGTSHWASIPDAESAVQPEIPYPPRAWGVSGPKSKSAGGSGRDGWSCERGSWRPSRRPAMSKHAVQARTGQGRASLYDEIIDKIIAELEAGRVPWVQPWGTAAAKRNWPCRRMLRLTGNTAASTS